LYYSISVMNKRKIFDVILVFNEYTILEERMKYLQPYVEKFVILDFGTGCKNYSSSEVIHFKATKEILSKDFDLVYEVIRIIDPKKLYVEDILMFSKVNEIPNINSLLGNLDLFYIKPIFFKQKKVFWESNLISPKSSFSAFAFTYSHYLLNKNLYDTFLVLKTPIPVNQSTIDCGWQLNGFQSKPELRASFEFWNEKEITEKELLELHSALLDFDKNLLVEFEDEIPNHFLDYQTHERLREAKKINLTLDSNFFRKSEELTLLIEGSRIISNNGHEFEFTLPLVEYYEDQNTSLGYSKNQTLKVLKHLNCLPHDIIICHKKETLDKVRLTYREFVETIPSELF